MAFSIIETSWDEHRAELSALRERVFIGADPASRHFLAFDDDQQPIGCIRLLGSGQISRLCVVETRRNSGIGRALLVAAEEAARAADMREIFLYAQTHATSFYEGAGFSASGGIFMDAHIPHRQMFKLLT